MKQFILKNKKAVIAVAIGLVVILLAIFLFTAIGKNGEYETSGANGTSVADSQPSSDNTPQTEQADYAITWVEPKIEALVRTAIKKPTGDIMRSELDFVTEINIGGDNIIRINDNDWMYSTGEILNDMWKVQNTEIGDIKSLSDFIHFKSLKYLNVFRNQISDLSPLTGMVNLTELMLDNNQISDLSTLSGLVKLQSLVMNENQISDISPLSVLFRLKTLGLSENQISDISPLSDMVKLQTLALKENQISDLTPLSGMVNLTKLYLEGNQITDWSPVAHVKNVDGRP